MSRLANTTNMIMKSERYWSKTTPRSLTLEDGDTQKDICVSPTLIDKSLKFCFKSGDRKIIKSVLDSVIFIDYLLLIIHTRISEIHMFNFVNYCSSSLITVPRIEFALLLMREKHERTKTLSHLENPVRNF